MIDLKAGDTSNILKWSVPQDPKEWKATSYLRAGDTIVVPFGRRKRTYLVHDEGERLKLERVPTKAEVVKTLGYDPESLSNVMRMYWRSE
jgi:hypothetical protein